MANEHTHPGHYLREWRKHRDKSQEELADAIPIDRTAISKIENGKLSYSQEFLEAAAKFLKCEPWEIIAVNPLRPTRLRAAAMRVAADADELAAKLLETLPQKRS